LLKSFISSLKLRFKGNWHPEGAGIADRLTILGREETVRFGRRSLESGRSRAKRLSPLFDKSQTLINR
jgi:hypothetical protein